MKSAIQTEENSMGFMELQITESTIDRRNRILGVFTIFLAYFVYCYFYQMQLSPLQKITANLGGMRWFPWGVSIPNLGLAFSMLLVGKLSDLYGRRTFLIASMTICLIGTLWSALSTTFVMLVIARTFLAIGQGALAPLCFSALGDMFEPAERGKWIGLLNIPAGAFAFVGPTLAGWFTDSLSWRYIFWCGAPLVIVCLGMVVFILPKRTSSATPSIDTRGALFAAVASSTMILAFSMAHTMYPWGSKQVLGLFAISIIFWALFLKAEAVATEPIVDLKVLKNRSFVTIVCACLLSSFGMAGLMVYYPLLLQGIQGASATINGQILTPCSVLMNFLGVPAGFILARTRRYKWMFLLSYGLTMALMFTLLLFNAATPIFWGFIAMTLAGIGMGAIPTLNTLAVQYAVPRRLLGVATGALFFSVMIGQALAPAILGSAMNMKYNNTLKATLPVEAYRLSDEAAVSSLGDSGVLLSEPAMAKLRNAFNKTGPNGPKIFQKTISAIRLSLEAGLRVVFIIGAIAMLLTFLTICTLPELSMDAPPENNETE
jgi:MFS family permease